MSGLITWQVFASTMERSKKSKFDKQKNPPTHGRGILNL